MLASEAMTKLTIIRNDTKQWVQICDRLERLGIRSTPSDDVRPSVLFFSDGKRRFKLIDILDRFIEIAEQRDGATPE